MAGDFDKTTSRLMAYSAVGTEMTFPIAVGIAIDVWRGWMPVCTIIGVVAGLATGILHLMQLVRSRRS